MDQPAEEPGRTLERFRAYLRLLGPATPQQVAGYLDAPVKEVRARWPEDIVEQKVDGETRCREVAVGLNVSSRRVSC